MFSPLPGFWSHWRTISVEFTCEHTCEQVCLKSSFSHLVVLMFSSLTVPPLCQYVLAVGSSVFHAMFYGELAEDQNEIRIPDVDPPSFLAMLKYVVLCRC